MSTKDVWTIVKRSCSLHPEYLVDQLAKSAVLEVVRLPVAHCEELNPIEMAWSQMRSYIKTHNTLFNLSDIERLTHAGFDVVTHLHWKSLIAHVPTKTEDHYWEV